MTINQSARLVRLLIGGLDFSAAFASYEGQDNLLDQSGLIKHTGKLTLLEVPSTAIASNLVSALVQQPDNSYVLTSIETGGIPESIDDRANYCRWQVGQTVTIDVQRENGSFARHPRGALRILSTTLIEEEGENGIQRSLEIELGCLLTLLDFKQPTDPDAAQIAIGGSNSGSAIASNLLAAAKVTNLGSVSVPLNINYDLEMSGGYVETVGKLLYSSRSLGWIDRWERFQSKPIDLSPDTTYTITIGQDELAYKRLTGMEIPRERIKVTGTGKLGRPCDPPPGGQFHCKVPIEEYGPANLVDPALGGGTILLSRTTECESWDSAIACLTHQTTIERPIGLALPNYDTPFKARVFEVEKQIERRYFETNKKGKLLKIENEKWELAGVPLAEYFEQVASPPLLQESLIQSQLFYTLYEYDCKERTIKITRDNRETIVAVVAGTGEDWTAIAINPTSLVYSEYSTESWEQKNKGDWQRTLSTLKPLARVYPESIQPDDFLARKTGLIALSPEIERSSAGQLTPPAAEHKPADTIFEDVAVEGTAYFKPLCPPGSLDDLKERERCFDIPYVPGLTGPPGEQCGREDKGVANAACEALARLEGALLLGRHKGQEIRLPLYDWILDNWEPLLGLVAIELNGSERVYLLDNSQWILEQQQALCSFDGIWVGDRIDNGLGGYNVLPPYAIPETTKAALVIAARSQTFPYSLNQSNLTQSAIALASRSFGGTVVMANTRSAIALASRSMSGVLMFNNTRSSLAIASRTASFISTNNTRSAIALASRANAFVVTNEVTDPIEVQFMGQGLMSDGIDPLEGEAFN